MEESVDGDYFIKRNNKYYLKPEIKDLVRFSYHNLCDGCTDSFPFSIRNIDIIFCRNVMIYFKKKRIEGIVNLFLDMLAEGGFLFVNNFDLIFPMFKEFIMRDFGDTIILQKKNIQGSIMNSYEETDKKNCSGSGAVDELFYTKTNVDEIIEEYLETAKILANQGKFNEAYCWCQRALSKDKLNIGIYYILSMILDEQQKFDEAVEILKKAVYIDNTFILGYYNLAILYQKTGDQKQAERYYNSALKLLEHKDNNYIIPFSTELTAGRLSKMIEEKKQINKKHKGEFIWQEKLNK